MVHLLIWRWAIYLFQKDFLKNQNNIYTVEDFIRYYPRKYLDRTNIKKIAELIVGEKIVVIATVKSFGLKNTRKGKYFHLLVDDETGTINCLWFHGISWIAEKFQKGEHIAIFGKVEFYKGYRIIHPEFDVLDEEDDPINTGCIVPMYSSHNQLKNVGLDSRGIRKIILKALDMINKNIQDHFDTITCKKEMLMTLKHALYNIHKPKDQFAIKNFH